VRLQYISYFFPALLRTSLANALAICAGAFMSLCQQQMASGDERPEALFTLSREEISEVTVEKIFVPLKSFAKWAGTKVLDVDEIILINDVAVEQQHLREAKVRLVSDSEADKLYFIRTMAVDEKKAEEKRRRHGMIEALLQADRDMKVEDRLKLQSQRRGERWEAEGDPGAAFIKVGDRCVVRRLDRGELDNMPPIGAYRAATYRDYRWAPIMSAADFVLSSGEIEPLTPFMAGPSQVSIFGDGSQRVTWELAGGRVQREIYFSAEHDLLPISMVDTIVSDGSPSKRFSASHYRWVRAADHQWVIDQYEAYYRTPLTKAERRGIYLSVSLSFSWSDRGHDSTYFDEQSVGSSAPFDVAHPPPPPPPPPPTPHQAT